MGGKGKEEGSNILLLFFNLINHQLIKKVLRVYKLLGVNYFLKTTDNYKK